MTSPTWIVLTVMSQRERSVEAELRRGLGLLTFVPYEIVTVRRHSKSFKLQKPMMPGYVFVGGRDGIPLDDLRDIRGVRGRPPYLMIDDEMPAYVTDLEVQRIQHMAQQEAKTRSEAGRLKIGDKVKLSGPFDGIETLITAVRGKRFEVAQEVFGKRLVLASSQLEHVEAA